MMSSFGNYVSSWLQTQLLCVCAQRRLDSMRECEFSMNHRNRGWAGWDFAFVPVESRRRRDPSERPMLGLARRKSGEVRAVQVSFLTFRHESVPDL